LYILLKNKFAEICKILCPVLSVTSLQGICWRAV